MDREVLKLELDLLSVNPAQYSLNGEFKPDSIILFHKYNVWEVFYLDERGGRNDERSFTSEGEACKYIYRIFKDAKEVESKFRIKT